MKNKKQSSLFISYNGLTDPLGQSQILPYVIGLAKSGYEMSILSCEKRDRFKAKESEISSICKTHGIKWIPLFFHTSPPILAKYYDYISLKNKATNLYRENNYDIIHCRSFLAARIGAKLKKKFNCKYLFDMRGFWVDERVDGGIWDLASPFYRYAYKKYKKKEDYLVGYADGIVCLTEAGKIEIQKWKSYQPSVPITVIPCSADLELFSVVSEDEKILAKQLLGIKEGTFVLSYLGSLGTWYLLEEMLQLFNKIAEKYNEAVFLILTPDDPKIVYQSASKFGIGPSKLVITFAERKDVPIFMKASNVSVSFIKPAYSKIASSPTKLGELLSMGIPVICNQIGDVGLVLQQSGGGVLLPDFSNASYDFVIEQLPMLMGLDSAEIRSNIYEYYSLDNAIKTYNHVYSKLLNS